MIVFDVMGLLNVSLQSNIDLTMGGRHHLVLSKYEQFFLKLKLDYQAELVFFCDGRVQKVILLCKICTVVPVSEGLRNYSSSSDSERISRIINSSFAKQRNKNLISFRVPE